MQLDDFIANETRKEDQLYKELATNPVSEVTGVVSANGVAAVKVGQQKLWSLVFTFDAWRVNSETVRTEPLRLRRRVTNAERRKWAKVPITAETVIRIRARVAERNVFGSPQGQLEEFIQIDVADSELHRHLAELKKPVTCRHERFGILTFSRQFNWYSAEVDWHGEGIDLNVNVEAPDDLVAALDVANALWDDESSWHNKVSAYAVQELLPLKNGNWLGDEETEFSPEQFEEKMTLQSITVYPNGEFEFWHDDGDLFWGHSILISGNLTDGLTHADIPG